MQHQDKSLNCLCNGKPIRMIFQVHCTFYSFVMSYTIFEQTLHTILNKRYIQKTKFSVCRLNLKTFVINHSMLDRTVHGHNVFQQVLDACIFFKTQIALKCFYYF